MMHVAQNFILAQEFSKEAQAVITAETTTGACQSDTQAEAPVGDGSGAIFTLHY
jgi:hypothetical protein